MSLMHFSFLSQERHNAKTVGEIKQFVSQLPHMQAARTSLANHTSIAELIKDITSVFKLFKKKKFFIGFLSIPRITDHFPPSY